MGRSTRCKGQPLTILVFALLAVAALCAPSGAAPVTEHLEPTVADVVYGPDPRNTLDFWQAPSEGPAPLIVYFHGGGFYEGDKGEFRRHADDIARCLEQGISLASVNYRFIEDASLPAILRDAARAIQFLRYQAGTWNIDTTRVAAFGESAGAGISLWLAFHDDLADARHEDPVLRESTRLAAAGALAPQSTYDFVKWPAILDIPQAIWYIATWYVNPAYYHLSVWETNKPIGKALRADLDFLAQIDAQDPPVYCYANLQDFRVRWTNFGRWLYGWVKENITGERVRVDPALNVDILHHPSHVDAIARACAQEGVPCVAVYRETPKAQRVGVVDFLAGTLRDAPVVAIAGR